MGEFSAARYFAVVASGKSGVTTKKRSSLLPEVPTIAEAGVSGFDYPIWYGMWVPAGTPAGVVDKLARDIASLGCARCA